MRDTFRLWRQVTAARPFATSRSDHGRYGARAVDCAGDTRNLHESIKSERSLMSNNREIVGEGCLWCAADLLTVSDKNA